MDFSCTSDGLTMSTARLVELRAELESSAALAAQLGWPIAPDWPPTFWQPEVIRATIAKIEEFPDEPFWRPWYVRCRGGVYCATAGFKGPPVDGMLELGYSVVPSHHRRGIATEIVQLLISWASRQFQVSRFCAHTLAGDPASSGVLRKNGFVSAGTVIDPEDGAIERFERKG